MFHNLHLKILSIVLAAFFWVFVASFESVFFEYPTKIPVQVYNMAANLALTKKPPSVKVTVSGHDFLSLKKLSPENFEAYIDLRSIEAGSRKIPITVISHNQDVTVVRVVPTEVEIELEPIREKVVFVTPDVSGHPAEGFSVSTVKLSKTAVTVSGAESVLKQVFEVHAVIDLAGNEKQTQTHDVTLNAVGRDGTVIDGVVIQDDITALMTIGEGSLTRIVGVRPNISGALASGYIKNIIVSPATISITGKKQLIDALNVVSTEPFDVSGLTATAEKKLKLVLPDGVSLETGASQTVSVTVEVENQQQPPSPVTQQ